MAAQQAPPHFAQLEQVQPKDTITDLYLTLTSLPVLKELPGKTIKDASMGAMVPKFSLTLICYSSAEDAHN
jgi:hypothetical protein